MSTGQGSQGDSSRQLEYISWGHQTMVMTTGHGRDGVPGLAHSPALLTIAFGGVAPDTWHTADTGMVVLAEDVAQLTLVFSQ